MHNEMKMFTLLVMPLLTAWLPTQINAQPLTFFGHALVRYENEGQFSSKPDRERMRLIARVGSKYRLSENVSLAARLSTGLKNQQNVPAHTIARFTTQKQPNNDVYVDQLFFTYQTDRWEAVLGRSAWRFHANTDIFWDRDLNPMTVFTSYSPSESHRLSGAFIKPLDGANATVGDLFITQYEYLFSIGSYDFRLAPWWVRFDGDTATFATRDTYLEHQSLRLAATMQYENWKLGIDVGHAIDLDASIPVDLRDQDTSLAMQVTHGKLKVPGDIQWHIRYMHIERFGVITEFAQNAIAARLTSNFAGWDARMRYRVSNTLWLGTRLSRVESLIGPSDSSLRFRLEARWSF